MALLSVDQSHDYSSDVLSGVTDITFATSAVSTTATFSPSQFDGIAISAAVHLTGDANQNIVRVNLSSPGSFSAAAWQISNWAPQDIVIIKGSAGADTITGSSQSDQIRGGAGADTLIGGSGNDVFFYEPSENAPGETIDGGAGNDLLDPDNVVGGATYDFSTSSMSNIERLGLERGTASGSATVILSGDQIGAGAITYVGGSAGAYVSNLIVKGAAVDLSKVGFFAWTAGTETITIKGTAGADNLIGSNQNDVIDGGLAGDHMAGGAGDDTYFVGAPSDVVDEGLSGSAGIDTVRSSISFNLANSAHAKGAVENLVLVGNANINGTGNAGANHIVGNRGHNIIAGGGGDDRLEGGAGADVLNGGRGHNTLIGGSGGDAFIFNVALSPANVADISDFLPVADVIKLAHAVFGNVASGVLSADAFHVGAHAADAQDRIIYSRATGNLYYDPDGTGGHAQTLLATIGNHAALSAADFVVMG